MIRHLFGIRIKPRRSVTLHESFTDSIVANSEFSVRHGEGRLHRPISLSHLGWFSVVFFILVVGVIFRIGHLQIVEGESYSFISENNTFDRVVVLPVRGNILDRNETPLAWNSGEEESSQLKRYYIGEGFSSLLGFIRYPQKDASGVFYRQETEGDGGVEEIYNHLLAGGGGSLVLERNVYGETLSELYIEEPKDGEDITLSIDAKIQKYLYDSIKQVAKEREFKAGSGILLDSTTGEILALASYPDFDNNVFTNYPDTERGEYLRKQKEGAFINRAISGLYSPGSTIKPFFAAAALQEDIISPSDIITSTGSITIQNPYDPEVVYVYKDWKEHGPLDIRGAIAWSSNVYFYHIGGGYENMTGLGIDRMNTYAGMFGFGTPTSLGVFNEPDGLVPTPKWKKNIHGEPWRVGDTYNTVIGQYAFQVTPLQIARGVAAIANGGYVPEVHLEKGNSSSRIQIPISEENLRTVRSGMRKTVLEGTAKSLNTLKYDLAVKTGTAQIGSGGIINSLLTGFLPYKNPRYVFVIIMERGEQNGAVLATRKFFDTLSEEYPDFFKM